VTSGGIGCGNGKWGACCDAYVVCVSLGILTNLRDLMGVAD
jgi:hypothetical protein